MKMTKDTIKTNRKAAAQKRDKSDPVSITKKVDILCPLCDLELVFNKRNIRTVGDCKCPMCGEDLTELILSQLKQ